MQPLNRRQPPEAPRRRDPAPSYWDYKMQRLWLTPFFRVLFRVGLPVFAIAAVTGLVMASESRRTAIAGGIAQIKEQFQARPEFRVSLLSIEGASPDLADAVRARMAVTLPASSFELDLDALREKAEGLDAVAKAELAVRSGGVLQVAIVEREPALIWREKGGLTLLDATGHRVAGLATRADRPDLPVIAGDGADTVAAEALALIDAAGPLVMRLRGLVRVGERRWDLVLDRNQRILLPTDRPVQALERLLALDQSDDLLARDLVAIDLRQDKRPVLRLGEDALVTTRRARGLIPKDEKKAKSDL
ncbi:MAG: cell division protein FtsQ/DivIB [Rhodobacteraceae bacterium]|nr:cell division protein FtsQ/DivIB [Paracoccaceae bacterium]